MSDFDAQFTNDEELRSLLERWKVPDPSQTLDNRVRLAYHQRMAKAVAPPDPALSHRRDSEVVTMKFCKTCQEEFAERFSFCPVDGTPLIVAPATVGQAQPSKLGGDAEGAYPVYESAVDQADYFDSGTAPVSVRPSKVATARPAYNDEYHLTILEDEGLLFRLLEELQEVAHEYRLTWPEFKRDPFGFVKRSAQGYGQMARRFLSSPYVAIAMLCSLLAMGALVGLIAFLEHTQGPGASRVGLIVFAGAAFLGLIGIFATWLSRERGAAVMGAQASDSRSVLAGIIASLTVVFTVVGLGFFYDRYQRAKAEEMARADEDIVQTLIDIPNEQPTPDEGNAGMAKGSGGGSKKEREKPGGGGGGGREELKPAVVGKLPQADLHIPQVVAPDPHPPVIKNPSLPVPATLDADPVLFPPDTRQINYGDPKSKSTEISSGPGTGNGIGTGKGGGVGPGEGGGYGPGRGGNTGGGDRHEGGGGPGGGGGGTDYSRTFSSHEVNQKARILEKPEPPYTEQARKDQIMGTVILRVVFASNGQVTGIRAVKGLADGLTENAIAAARRIKFVPATKDGHAVSMYAQLEYTFTIY